MNVKVSKTQLINFIQQTVAIPEETSFIVCSVVSKQTMNCKRMRI